MPKKFEENTKYSKHDLDGDGVITDEEIAREKELIELELRSPNQKRNKGWLGWLCLACLALVPFVYAFYT